MTTFPRTAAVIARGQRRLCRCPTAAASVSPRLIEVTPTDPDGFVVRLRATSRGAVVEFDGWSRRFDRDEDALDCFEFGLSPACRLRVEYRGQRAVAWTVESREYGCWTPHRRMARWLVPFWRRRRLLYRQNRHEFVAV